MNPTPEYGIAYIAHHVLEQFLEHGAIYNFGGVQYIHNSH